MLRCSQQQGLVALVMSILAGAFGVQSEQNRRRDFKSGNVLPFVIGGILFVLLFILALIGIVNIVLGLVQG